MEEKCRIMKKCKGKSQDAFIRELERTYEGLVQERNLTPYCGIIISWLESKLKKSWLDNYILAYRTLLENIGYKVFDKWSVVTIIGHLLI